MPGWKYLEHNTAEQSLSNKQRTPLPLQMTTVLIQNTSSIHTSLANYFLTLVVFREYAADNKAVAESGSGTRPVTC